MALNADTREDYGEDRWIAIGKVRDETVVMVLVEPAPDTIRSFQYERLNEMSASRTKTRSRTDWTRVRAMTDKDIDTSDIPELGPDFFKTAIWRPGPKKQVTLRLDPDVLEFFRKQGKRYQSTINAVLRRYMQLHQRRAS